MLYANIDFKAAIGKQRNNKGKQFYKPSNSSSTLAVYLSSRFGMLAWQPFQTTSFVCDFTLTLKALGFFLPVQRWGVFSTPSVKLDPDILENWNLQGW